MSLNDDGLAAQAGRVPRWAGALETVLFVVGLAAQLFLWLHVTSLEGQVALVLAGVVHLGIAAVRSHTVNCAGRDATAGPEGQVEPAGPAPSVQDDERLAFPSTMTRPATELTWRDIEAIPGLQANAALRLHGGDKRAYLHALRRFTQRYKDGVNHWGTWLDSSRWDDLDRAVQALHQQAGSIGALRVQAGAGRLAMQCDGEDRLGGHAGLPALQDDLSQVLGPLLDAGFGDPSRSAGLSLPVIE